MNEFEKLYTVEDIANMVGMTDRTIRNYLKASKLKGVKVGGQWRFTKADIDRLLSDGAEVQSAAADGDIADFLSGSTCKNGAAEACTVIDLLCEKSYAAELASRINSEISSSGEFDSAVRSTYTYDDAAGKARFAMRGSLDSVAAIVKLVRKQSRKGKE